MTPTPRFLPGLRGRPAIPVSWVLGIALALAAFPGPEAEAADPFYERRLREGTLALEQGRPEEAARRLEIAAFGLLDEPPRLAEALVRLALAHVRLDDATGFRDTFRRIAEIEDRFGAYRDADLTPVERSTFEEWIGKWVPPPLLASSPGFQELVESAAGETEAVNGEAANGDTESAETESAETESAAQDESAARTEDEARGGPEEPETAPTETTEGSPLSTAEAARVERATEILDQARQAQELQGAFELARSVADAHPGNPALQFLVGEIAYRSSRWREAARYLARGGDPLPDRPELLFYLAVALHESGRTEEARTPLQRALPRLEQTEFVDKYVREILGDDAPRSAREVENSPGAPPGGNP